MWERERERKLPERKRRGQNVEIQSEFAHTEKIIIPQTIRSVIRIYLLWRGSINREDKKKKAGGETEKYVISPRCVLAGRKSRLSNFRARAIRTKWRSEKPGRERSKYICENERERMKNLYTTGERERESVKQRA